MAYDNIETIKKQLLANKRNRIPFHKKLFLSSMIWG